jgi:acyl carrier protein
VAFTRDDDGATFSLKSAMDPEAAASEQWLSEHVQGRVVVMTKAVPVVEPLDTIMGRCQSRVVDVAGSVEHDHMDFGGRWQCLQKSYYGNGEALAELVLPERYISDLANYALHPALLDMTTAVGFELAPEYQPEKDFFVPLSYGSVAIYQPVPQHVFGRVVFKDAGEGNRCCYDLELRAPDGTLLVAISDFVAKRMSHDILDRESVQEQASALQEELELAITPSEGGETICRLLVHPEVPQVVVSTTDFSHRFVLQGELSGAQDQPEVALSGQQRPELSSGYIAPESEHEQRLAELWQAALGISDIGVADNFFELGGHSLMLTQLVSKAKKQLGINLPLSKLFDKPTIKNWLSLVEVGASAQDKPKASPIKRVSRSSYKKKG